MTTHKIPLESFTPKSGVKIKLENGELHIPAEKPIAPKNRHHVHIPGKYKLPFRVDMAVKLHTEKPPTQLHLYAGKGNVYFNNGVISCTDILTVDKKVSVFGDVKMANYLYHNNIPKKEYVDISIMFGSKTVWIAVDGIYCYSTDKMSHIKMLRENILPVEFADGLGIGLCVGTHTQAKIKSFTISEYENDEPEIPAEIADLPELSQFELYVKGLPPEVHGEMFKTDEFLLKDMKSSLKFKRGIDKFGHLTYKSPCGFIYTIREYGVSGHHSTDWIHNSNKADYTNKILNKLAGASPEFADKMFSQLQICNPHSKECGGRTIIEFNGKSSSTCRGKIFFKMIPSEFEDLRKVVAATGEVMKANKISGG